MAVSKKAFVAAILVSLVCASLFVGMQSVNVTKANFVPQVAIFIHSPINQTYSSLYLTLYVTIDFALTEDKWIAYSLDGNDNVTLTGKQSQLDSLWQRVNITAPLVLSEGSHRLDVYAQSVPASYAAPDTQTVFFTIDTSMPSNSPSTSPMMSSTPSPSASLTPSIPSSSPSPSPTPTSTLNLTNPPTQQLTLEPTSTSTVEPIPHGIHLASYALQGIIIGSFIAVVVGLIVYFKKVKG